MFQTRYRISGANKQFWEMPSERSIVSTALSAALGQVWECIEFWTPLTSVIIILWLLYRPDHFYPTVDSAVLATLNSHSRLSQPPQHPVRPGREHQLPQLSQPPQHPVS